MKKKTNWAKTKRYLPLYLMLLPGAAYLIINNYLPMAGLVLAFKKVNYNVGLFQSPWTGSSNICSPPKMLLYSSGIQFFIIWHLYSSEI